MPFADLLVVCNALRCGVAAWTRSGTIFALPARIVRKRKVGLVFLLLRRLGGKTSERRNGKPSNAPSDHNRFLFLESVNDGWRIGTNIAITAKKRIVIRHVRSELQTMIS
jgi:hypothetical protein